MLRLPDYVINSIVSLRSGGMTYRAMVDEIMRLYGIKVSVTYIRKIEFMDPVARERLNKRRKERLEKKKDDPFRSQASISGVISRSGPLVWDHAKIFRGGCQYIYGDLGYDGYSFCGDSSLVDGSVYCKKHYDLCYKKKKRIKK